MIEGGSDDFHEGYRHGYEAGKQIAEAERADLQRQFVALEHRFDAEQGRRVALSDANQVLSEQLAAANERIRELETRESTAGRSFRAFHPED